MNSSTTQVGSEAPTSSSTPSAANGVGENKNTTPTTDTSSDSNTDTDQDGSQPTTSSSSANMPQNNSGGNTNTEKTATATGQNGAQIGQQQTSSPSATSSSTGTGVITVIPGENGSQSTTGTAGGSESTNTNTNDAGLPLPTDQNAKNADTNTSAGGQSNIPKTSTDRFGGNGDNNENGAQSTQTFGGIGSQTASPPNNDSGAVTAGPTPSTTSVPLYDQLTHALDTNTDTGNGENTETGGNLPASVTSNGVLISNPQITSHIGNVGQSVTNGVGNGVASITSNGVLIPNPTDQPEGTQPSTGQAQGSQSSGGGVPGGVVPASITSNGQLIANPATTALGQSASIPASITLPNHSVIQNPDLTATKPEQAGQGQNQTLTGGASASMTLPNGEVVPLPQQTNSQEGNNSSQPLLTTLPNGEVVPLPTSMPVGEKQTESVGQPTVIGSSTLPNGQVVPITSSPSSPSQGAEHSNSGAQASPPVQSSTTLPNGEVVPITSASGFTGSASAAKQGSGAQETGSVASQASQAFASAASQSSANGAGAGANQQTGSGANTSQATTTGTGAGAGAGAGGESHAPAPTTGPVATQPQSYPFNGKGPFSQKPTGYDQNTMQPVQSSIIFAPSISQTSGQSSPPTGLPTGVPLVLYPPTGPVKRPDNTDLIQIGFLYPLNYDFVRMHQESQKQIFTFLPRCIAYGLDIELENVTMQTLRAWDTTEDLHYITTLALAWIPSHLVDTLAVAIHTPPDKFYNNPNPSVRTLSTMINSAIPIRADNETSGGTATVGSTPPDSTDTAGAAPVGGNIGNSSPVKASSVGIGVGVVCGAAAYGAAMFFVARRYKKRRQSHMRSPSMFSSPVMSHAGPDPAAGAALMSGAMGGERSVSPYYDRADSRGSGRSGGSSGRQQISAPVMAENSLGWN